MNPLIILLTNQIQQADAQKGVFLWISILSLVLIVAAVCIIAMRNSCHLNNPLPEEVNPLRKSEPLSVIASGTWVDVWHFTAMDVLLSKKGKRMRYQFTLGGNLNLYEDLNHFEASGRPQKIQIVHTKDEAGSYTTYFKRAHQKQESELLV